MPRSTARFISYDLRPAKQSERRILLDIFKVVESSERLISEYRYIGMGANRFYDFLMIHKYVGIDQMISLEHDATMFQRALLNRPYSFVEIRNSTVQEFIAEDPFLLPTLTWLDYDGGVSPTVVADISSLALKMQVNDFFFVTLPGGPPRSLRAASDQDRLVWLQDTLGDIAGQVVLGDTSKASFPVAVHKCLTAAFRNAFASRRDGRFLPLFEVVYSDSIPMVTFGGGLLREDQAVALTAKMKRVLPFLKCGTGRLYKIESFHLTERERDLFDMAATKPRAGSAESRKLKSLGFDDDDIRAYKDLIRYLPRYVETIV